MPFTPWHTRSVNFFGHVAAASWRGASPAFALGAMLPDLTAMTGTRPARIEAAEVSSGVAFHHTTDAAFHDLEAFVRLCASTSSGLRARGLPRGSARGAAHVAVELALDGVLVGDPGAAELYVSALADDAAAGAIVLEGESRRFFALRDELASRGIPAHYQSPAFVARAVRRALSRRPRLALLPGHEAILEAELPAHLQRVRAAAPGIFADLRASLARPKARAPVSE